MAEDGIQLSLDRETRIAARRKRIQEKLAAIRQGDSSGTTESTQQQEASKSTLQLQESSRRLLRLRHDTQKVVTTVRVQGDELENARRDKEERLRQELRSKLLSEAEASAAANAAVAVQWGSVLSLNVPQDLFRAIEEQRVACGAVIARKDRLITDRRAALKGKDEEYVQLLKRQAADIDTLLAAMSRQLQDLSAAYREELENVERALLQERAELLATNRKDVLAMLEARSAAEASFTDRYLAAVESCAANLEGLRHADAEEYQVLKVKLESDIAVLEQHLETMRATYQLNAEKLDYNYRVLLERDAENTATINQQKRKLSWQHDVLSNLKQEYGNSDCKFSEENSKLTDEYKRITEQFKDLQAKFHRAVKVDASKHTQLWRLQQEEACGLVRQLLAADRVIHQQQLGLDWLPPDEGLFVSPHDLKPAAQQQQQQQHVTTCSDTLEGLVEQQAAGSEAAADGRAGDDCQEAAMAAASITATGSECGRTSGSSSGGSNPGMAYGNGNAEVAQRLSEPQHYGALCLLVDEAGFLIESKTAALIAQLPVNEGQLVAAGAIVRALGVTDGPAFDALLDALSEDQGAGAAARTTLSLSGAPPPPPVLVAPDAALVRLRQFVEAEAGISSSPLPAASAAAALGDSSKAAAGLGSRYSMAADAAGSTQAAAGAGGAGAPALMSLPRTAAPGSLGLALANSVRVSKAAGQASTAALGATAGGAKLGGYQGQVVVSRRAQEKEREYWDRLAGAVDDRTMRVWSRLEQQLRQYHGLLVQRAEGLAAIGGLQQQNDELRLLLSQYLSSKINSDLKIPPYCCVVMS